MSQYGGKLHCTMVEFYTLNDTQRFICPAYHSWKVAPETLVLSLLDVKYKFFYHSQHFSSDRQRRPFHLLWALSY